MPKRSISTTKALRQENRNRIFKYLYKEQSGCTKQEISAALGMSLPTVTQNITELMQMGVLKYRGTTQSTGGRKPRLISVCDKSRFAIGVSITKRHLRFVAVGFYTQQLGFRKTEFDFEKCEDISGFIARELESFMTEEKLSEKKLLGVRITVPGIINAQEGMVEFAPTLQASPISIESIVQKIAYKCSVENDANAGGFAERYNTKENTGVAYISLDRGVGGSVFLNGIPYLGNNSRSGEFGHICIHPRGRACSCKKHGCLEAYCSTDRISNDLGISLERFFEELKDDGNYQNLWQEYLADLSIGLDILQTILDCKIILGGALAPYLEEYLPILQRNIATEAQLLQSKNKISLSRFGANSNCVGAALHYIANFVETV